VSTLLENAAVAREPGPPIASFTTYGDAYAYQQILGGFGHTVTADTMLGYAVRRWITHAASRAEIEMAHAHDAR